MVRYSFPGGVFYSLLPAGLIPARAHGWHIAMKSAAFMLGEQNAVPASLRPPGKATPLNKDYFGIRNDPGMFSSSVAKIAAFAFASLHK